MQKGSVQTAEAKQKIRAAWTPERRTEMSRRLERHWRNPENRRAMSATMKAALARRREEASCKTSQ